MNIRRLSSRATVAAATTALAASALVGATATTASAAEVTNTYTCSNAALNFTGDFPLTVNGGLPPQAWAGAAIPGGLLKGAASATVPVQAQGLLALAQIDGARSGDFALDLGTASVPMPANGTFSQDYSTWTGSVENAKFTTPAPGTYTVSMPQSFTFTTVKDGQDSVTLDCTLAEGQEAQSLGETVLAKQTNTTVTAKKAVAKKGKVAKIKVSVSSDAGAVSLGKVVAKKGKKTYSAKLKNGAATIKVGKLPKGKHKFTVSYAGNKSIAGASTKATVTVK